MNREFWVGKRVLITGHTGFKGSWLSLWLHELGANVAGIGLEPDTSPSVFAQLNLTNCMDSHLIDIREIDKITKVINGFRPQIVFHLAAQPLVLRSYQAPLETWSINVMGSLNILEALRSLSEPCAVVMITTDKVYENRDWDYGYRESDRLGGNDPYSASKAAAELAINSWKYSFCGTKLLQSNNLGIATARAGNVIGGGDWAQDRIVPDAIRALLFNQDIGVRNPKSTRPWQHVLEPLNGYMILAQNIYSMNKLNFTANQFCEPFNFGPPLSSNQAVSSLIEQMLLHWPGGWQDLSGPNIHHEAVKLHLQIDKSYHRLNWRPCWDFEKTIDKTVNWYKKTTDGVSSYQCCLDDIHAYTLDYIPPRESTDAGYTSSL